MRRCKDQFWVRVKRSFLRLALVFLALSGNLRAAPIDQYFYQGYVAETHGDYDQAIPNWDEVLRLNPNDLAAFKNRGLAYYYKDDYARSIHDFSEAIRRKSNDIAAFDGRGFAHFQRQDWDEAISDFESAIHLNPRNAALYLNLGRVYLTKGDYDNAITNFTKRLRLNPRNDWAYNCRAVAHEYKGETAAAIADFRMALSISPNYADVYVNCGNMFRWQRESMSVAITDYTEAIRLDPTNGDTYITRAEAYQARTNFDLALDDYNTAIQLSPANAGYYFQRGYFEFQMTNYDAAAGDYDQSVRLAPTNNVYLSYRGRLREVMTNYDGAIMDFSRCIQQQPTNTEYYTDRAGADERAAKAYTRPEDQKQRADDLDRARDDWDQAAAMDSHCLIGLGEFEGRKGQFENAIADFGEYAQIYPADYSGWFWRAVAYEYLAVNCARRGELAEKDASLTYALADWNHLAAMNTNETSIFICLRGDFFARNGQYTEALNDYHQAVELEPSHIYPLISLGWFLATCPERKLRNGALALTTIKKGFDLAATNGCETDGYDLAAMAAAYAETGDFAQAVEFQNQALKLLAAEGYSDSLRAEMAKRLALYQKNRRCHRPMGVYLFD